MFTFFSLIIFFGVLFIFGWQLARFVLKENRIEALIPLATISGPTVYLLALNLLSYFIKIQINFYLIGIILIFFSYFLFRLNKKQGKAEWGIDKKWRKILFGTCLLIMIFIGIIGIRDMSAMLNLPGQPLTATMAEGNFPVRDLGAPNFPFQYHYGNNLLSAAIFKITNLPIWFAWDLQNFIFVGVLFLSGFLLIRYFCKDNFKSYIASLIMILGGDLNFLYYGARGLLYPSAEAPFKFVNDMIFGGGVLRGESVVVNSSGPWHWLSFALTITVIYLYFRAINDKNNWLKISLLAGVIFSFLALVTTLFFGAVGMVLFAYPLVYAVLKGDWQNGKFFLKVSFLILVLGAFIASLQGGIVTQIVKQTFFGYNLPVNLGHFSITLEYVLKGLILTMNGYEKVLVPFFSPAFFWGWGWLVIFIIPTAIYILRKYFQPGLFLLLLIFIAFFLPLIATNDFYADLRVNFLTALFWNLIFGLFLGWLFMSFKNKWQKSLVIILILGVIFQGLFYLVLFSIFPRLQRGHPFLSELPRPNPTAFEAVGWIRENTTIKDYFLTFEEGSLPVEHNAKFIIFTGRFAPNFYDGLDAQYPQFFSDLEATVPEMVLYREILKECLSEAIKTLNYRYLYVNKDWPEGLEEKCLANNDLELKFEARDGNEFARIYEVK